MGVVENHPVAEGMPAKGATVHVRTEDISDWAYIDASGKTHGIFVERLLGSSAK